MGKLHLGINPVLVSLRAQEAREPLHNVEGRGLYLSSISMNHEAGYERAEVSGSVDMQGESCGCLGLLACMQTGQLTRGECCDSRGGNCRNLYPVEGCMIGLEKHPRSAWRPPLKFTSKKWEV